VFRLDSVEVLELHLGLREPLAAERGDGAVGGRVGRQPLELVVPAAALPEQGLNGDERAVGPAPETLRRLLEQPRHGVEVVPGQPGALGRGGGLRVDQDQVLLGEGVGGGVDDVLRTDPEGVAERIGRPAVVEVEDVSLDGLDVRLELSAEALDAAEEVHVPGVDAAAEQQGVHPEVCRRALQAVPDVAAAAAKVFVAGPQHLPLRPRFERHRRRALHRPQQGIEALRRAGAEGVAERVFDQRRELVVRAQAHELVDDALDVGAGVRLDPIELEADRVAEQGGAPGVRLGGRQRQQELDELFLLLTRERHRATLLGRWRSLDEGPPAGRPRSCESRRPGCSRT
jgi:hypothetical protein